MNTGMLLMAMICVSSNQVRRLPTSVVFGEAALKIVIDKRSRYLDQTNISSAYVSGMKEDLELDGNELN